MEFWMTFYNRCEYIIIPTDEVHHLSEGLVETTNQDRFNYRFLDLSVIHWFQLSLVAFVHVWSIEEAHGLQVTTDVPLLEWQRDCCSPAKIAFFLYKSEMACVSSEQLVTRLPPYRFLSFWRDYSCIDSTWIASAAWGCGFPFCAGFLSLPRRFFPVHILWSKPLWAWSFRTTHLPPNVAKTLTIWVDVFFLMLIINVTA